MVMEWGGNWRKKTFWNNIDSFSYPQMKQKTAGIFFLPFIAEAPIPIIQADGIAYCMNFLNKYHSGVQAFNSMK